MTDRRTIALDFLRLAQEDLVRASTLVASRIELAYEYGATEDDIMHTIGGGEDPLVQGRRQIARVTET